MSLFEVQLAALFLLFLGTFFCGCLPILVFRLDSNRCFHEGRSGLISFLLYFGGGVLFSTAMLHLLPEAQHQLTHHSHDHSPINASQATDEEYGGNSTTAIDMGHHHSFPWPEFIVLCGFFATYLIDVVVRMILERQTASASDIQSIRAKFCSCSLRNIECSRTFKPDVRHPASGKRRRSATWAGYSSPAEKPNLEKSERGSPPDLLRSSIISHQFPNYGALIAHESESNHLTRSRVYSTNNRQVSSPPQLPQIPELSNWEHSQPAITLASIMTVTALSFHSVFEGFAIGFQKTAIGMWTLLLGVSIHKFVIAFVIGLEALVEGSKLSLVLCCMFVFAVLSPAGMGLAMSLDNIGKQTSSAVIGGVNCVATGTLLYVTFYEVFPRKSERGSCDKYRFWGTIVGAAVMAALQYATTVI